MMLCGFLLVEFVALGTHFVRCHQLLVALVVETSNKIPRCCGKFIESKKLELVRDLGQSGMDVGTVFTEGLTVL